MVAVMKGKNVDAELRVEAAGAEGIPPIDAAAPAVTETATFALG